MAVFCRVLMEDLLLKIFRDYLDILLDNMRTKLTLGVILIATECNIVKPEHDALAIW